MMYTNPKSSHIDVIPPQPLVLEPAGSENAHYFFTHEEVRGLGNIFSLSYRHFIELHEYVHLRHVLEFIDHSNPQLSLSATSQTAFHQPVADYLATHLADIYKLPASLASDIKTCLQEAVMNAVIHGNLVIKHDEQTRWDFQKYIDKVTHAIKDMELSLKRVSVYVWASDEHITICVADQGKGFNLNQPTPYTTSPYGRGLVLIRHMCHRLWQTQPNYIYMQFLRKIT